MERGRRRGAWLPVGAFAKMRAWTAARPSLRLIALHQRSTIRHHLPCLVGAFAKMRGWEAGPHPRPGPPIPLMQSFRTEDAERTEGGSRVGVVARRRGLGWGWHGSKTRRSADCADGTEREPVSAAKADSGFCVPLRSFAAKPGDRHHPQPCFGSGRRKSDITVRADRYQYPGTVILVGGQTDIGPRAQ
jgi:hypothetical protein